MKNNNYAIRPAFVNDIDEIYRLKKHVWNDNAASKSMLIVRNETFPVGQLVAVDSSNNIVGYTGFFRTEKYSGNVMSWYDLTSYGYINGVHKQNGNYIFGMRLTVHPKYPEVGHKLHETAIDYMVENNMHGIYHVSRVPGFSMASEKYSIDQWVFGENNKSKDQEISYYQKQGYRIVNIIPDYYDDEESGNYGVLMLLENPYAAPSENN